MKYGEHGPYIPDIRKDSSGMYWGLTMNCPVCGVHMSIRISSPQHLPSPFGDGNKEMERSRYYLQGHWSDETGMVTPPYQKSECKTRFLTDEEMEPIIAIMEIAR